MSCPWKEDSIQRFADGTLDPEMALEFERHARECATCCNQLAQDRALDDRLRLGIAPVPAPATLAARVTTAIAAERRPRFGLLPLGRRFAPALISLALAVALGVGAYLVAPGAVTAVVQRALVFIPGIGISEVDEANLVAPNPVSVEAGGVTLTVNALFSNGKQTDVEYTVTGLPGGKEGWNGQSPSSRAPILRDDSGKEYRASSARSGVGGSPSENTITGGMTFPPLPGSLKAVDLVIPMDYLVPPAVVPAAGHLEWVAAIPLAHPAESGLPAASPQLAASTSNGVTLRVAASHTGTGQTVVRLEGTAGPFEQLVTIGRVTGDPAQSATLRDDTGQEYRMRPDSSMSTGVGPGYHQDLYFDPVASLARQVTLSIAAVQVQEKAAASCTISFPGRAVGEVFSVDRSVDLGGHKVLLKSAALEEDTGQVWLYVDVDLGPTLNGRTLTSFGLQGSSNGSMMSLDSAASSQVARLGAVLKPGSRNVTLQLVDPVVEVEGNWVLTFAASGE